MVSFAVDGVRRGLGVPQAVHRPRARAGWRVCAVRRGSGGALPGHRSAEPRVRSHRRRGRPDRLLPRQPHELAALDRVPGLHRVRRRGERRLRRPARPRVRGARPAREDDGHPGPGAHPAGGDGVAGPGGRSVRARAPASDHEPSLRGLRRDRHAHADARARVRSPPHDRNDRVPALHEARHRDARTRERPRDHGHARRARAQGRARGLARLGHRVRRRRPSARRPVHVARLHGAHVPRDLVARRRADRPAALALGHAGRRARRRPPAGRRDAVCLDHGLPHGGALRARDHRAAVVSAAIAPSRSRGRRASACSLQTRAPRSPTRGVLRRSAVDRRLPRHRPLRPPGRPRRRTGSRP